MAKSKISRADAGKLFAHALEQRFPGVHSEVMLDTVEGEDLTVRTVIPEGLGDIHLDVVGAAGDLKVEFAEKYGLYIATMTIDLYDAEKEPVHG
jgi:hypothetical protein